MTVVERAVAAWRERVAASSPILAGVTFDTASGAGNPEAMPQSVISAAQLAPGRVCVPFTITETVQATLTDEADDYPNAFEAIVNELSSRFDEKADIGNPYARIHRSVFVASATLTPTGKLRKAVIKWTVYASWEVAA